MTTCLVVKPDACFRFLPFVLRAIYRENFSILGMEIVEMNDDHIKFFKSKVSSLLSKFYQLSVVAMSNLK